MANANIKVINKSRTKIIASDFNERDDKIPFDTDTINGGGEGSLKTGDFTSLSIGVQVQEGGRWVLNPLDEPFPRPGDTVTVILKKEVS